MATTDLDKFVLQYSVDLKDSIQRLEDLQDSIQDANRGADEGRSKLGRFGHAFNNISRDLPEPTRRIGAMVENLGRVGVVAGGATAGFLAMAASVKIASDQMKQLNEQRLLAMKVGMGALDLENFQRNAAATGLMNRPRSAALIQKVSDLSREAYTDPTQTNRAAFLLHNAGVDINGSFGQIANLDDVMRQLSKTLSAMPKDQAYAQGQLMGLDQNDVDALRQINGAIKDMTRMTDEQAAAYMRAQEAARDLQVTQSQLSAHWDRLKADLGDELLPVLDRVADAFLKVVDAAVKVADHVTEAAGAAANEAGRNRYIDEGLAKAAAEKRAHAHSTDAKTVQDQLNGHSRLGKLDLGAGFTTRGATEMMRQNADNAGLTEKEKSDLTAKLGKEFDEKHKKEAQQARDEANNQARLAESARQTAASFDRSIALFAASVSTFSSDIDEHQAWAEWAGALGAASGIPFKAGQSSDQSNREAWDNNYGGKVDTPQYHPDAAPQTRSPAQSSNDHTWDRIIIEASKKEGVDPLLTKRPFQKDPEGAVNLFSKLLTLAI